MRETRRVGNLVLRVLAVAALKKAAIVLIL